MRLSPITIVLTLLLASAWAQEQEQDERRVRDHGYLFQLEHPGPAWRLHGEAEARRMNSSALAALINPREALGALVVVEQAPGVSPSELGDLVYSSAPLERKRLNSSRELTYLGQPAVRLEYEGELNGLQLSYFCTIVCARGYAYQIVCWGPTGRVTSKSCAPVWQAFSLLEGDRVPGRSVSSQVPDAEGVGWLVRGNKFTSAAYGLVLDPRPGWHLMVGDELDRSNEDAEAGLSSSSPEIYFVVIPERVSGMSHEHYAKGLRQSFTENVGQEAGRELTLPVAGGQAKFTLREVQQGATFEFAHAVVSHNEFVYQLIGWWVTDLGEKALPQLKIALEQVRFLSSDERQELEQQLAAAPDPQNVVGSDYSLRGGIYRDFTHDFRWHKPAGFWRVRTGAQARSMDSEARLTLELPEQGLMGMLTVKGAAGLSAEFCHRAAVEPLLPVGEEVGEPTRRRVRGGEFSISWVDSENPLGRMSFMVATAKRGASQVQLLLWGLIGNLNQGRQKALDALDGVELLAHDLQATERAEGQLKDRRLGFSYDPPGEGWVMKDMGGQLNGSSVGSVLQWRRGEQSVGVVSMCVGGIEQNMAWFDQFLGEVMLDRLREDLGLEFEEPVEIQLSAQSASLRVGREPGGSGRVHVTVLRRDLTFYGIIAADRDSEGPELEQLSGGFQLLD